MVHEDVLGLTGKPERIFVSVDQRTGRSTMSFAPREVGNPVVREADAGGAQALTAARAIAARYPGCGIVGPHFHASKAGGKTRRRGRF